MAVPQKHPAYILGPIRKIQKVFSRDKFFLQGEGVRMKLSKCLLLMALSLPAAGHAQTSQTFHFGEGQSSLGEGQSTPQRGHANSAPARPAGDSTQPQPEARSKSKSRHRQHHRGHTTGRSPLQDPYSRP
ncbi:MAG TPA: hypothetical protein VJS30_00130 [Paraburkholderia sp.]|nr:hypothetical protein [Paraburkholderia sp.]